MRNFATLLVVGLSFAISNCKTNEKTTTSKAGQQNAAAATPATFLKGFLLPSQIAKPAQVNDVAQSDLTKRINNLGPLIYYNAPATANSPGCVDSVINSAKAVASKDRFSFDIPNADLTACMAQEAAKQSTSTASVTITKASMRVQIRGICEGGDVSVFNGKAGSEVAGDFFRQFCQVGDRASTLMNIEFKQSVQLRMGTATISYDTTTLSGMMDANGNACVSTRKNNEWVLSPCRKFEIISTSNLQTTPAGQQLPAGLVMNEYYIAEFANLIGVTRGRYYNSGVITLDYNDWQGQIRYSGSDVPPTWSLSNATKGTASGTFVPYTTAGLRLHRLTDTTSVELGELMPRLMNVWF